ncbi:MAG: Co2+/Mg2+ efflux protein ApaG [Vicinamibacteria bacterium]|nr:Co2+/Mg2+ efflux protein ApaG [Vicinamibacteria bacterium]
MSDATTNGVKVQVAARYVEERSNPHANKFIFAYTVTITNTEAAPVQLLSRKWIIKDADGDIETIEGPGVVGEKPVLQPGQSFEYTSFCPLETPFGTMEGHYNMVAADGSRFEARIAPFGLATPGPLN